MRMAPGRMLGVNAANEKAAGGSPGGSFSIPAGSSSQPYPRPSGLQILRSSGHQLHVIILEPLFPGRSTAVTVTVIGVPLG